jgi:hypothetical protein
MDAHLQEPVAGVLHCFPPDLREPRQNFSLVRLAGDTLANHCLSWNGVPHLSHEHRLAPLHFHLPSASLPYNCHPAA